MSRFRVHAECWRPPIRFKNTRNNLNNYYLIIFRKEVRLAVTERARSLLLPKQLANGLGLRFVISSGKS